MQFRFFLLSMGTRLQTTNQNCFIFQYPRVFPGDLPLTKKPENYGFETHSGHTGRTCAVLAKSPPAKNWTQISTYFFFLSATLAKVSSYQVQVSSACNSVCHCISSNIFLHASLTQTGSGVVMTNRKWRHFFAFDRCVGSTLGCNHCHSSFSCHDCFWC